LLSHSRPIASLLNPIGVSVVALGDTKSSDTAVFDSPGGKQIGTQSIDARGKITGGPVQIGGQNYYFVQFVSGKSGWVLESDIGAVESEPTPFENFLIWIIPPFRFFEFLSILISLCLVGWIAYIVYHLTQIRKNAPRAFVSDRHRKCKRNTPEINPKWKKVLAHLESQNESDWKLAVIECDIMLDDILDKLHFARRNDGEKMKAVEKSDFTTIDNAWEAHKIRNQVAHEGGDYVLNQHEARRVVALYQTVSRSSDFVIFAKFVQFEL